MLINGVEYKIASTVDDIKKAYALVYENYIEKKFCDLNIHKMRIFLFDSLATTRTFIAIENDIVLATTTLVFDSPIGLPSEVLYKDVLTNLRTQGKKICEISKLSTRHDLGAKALKILPQLFRTCWLYAKEINPHSHFCILVEPHNEGFYQKFYFFEKHSEMRLDHKSNEAPSILLEMPIKKNKAEIEQSSSKNNKIIKMHFDDPLIENILMELQNIEENISKINLSLLTPRTNRTLALTSDEKKFLEFKFFIIRYNLDQISKYALSQSSRGWYHEAAESYENLMKTLPSWAFSKEKDYIYENLCDFYLTTGAYQKQIEMAQKLQNSTNHSSSIQGRNLQALGLFGLGKIEEAFAKLKEAEEMAREYKDSLRLSSNYHYRGKLLNQQGKYIEALSNINQAIEISKQEIPFSQNTTLYYTLLIINDHLGNIKECAKISNKFLNEIPYPEKESIFVAKVNYYSCVSRYNIMRLHHLEALKCFDVTINRLVKKEEMPFNYAVELSNSSLALLAVGNLGKALKRNQEALDLKEYYFPRYYVSFLIKKFGILIFLDDTEKINAIKEEIDTSLLKIGKKYSDFPVMQIYLITENRIKGNNAQLLKQLESLDKETTWNKPQLSGEMDFTTVYLLLGKPKLALKHLNLKLKPREKEIVDSEIDNKNLIAIYHCLIKNDIASLHMDLQELFLKDIQKEEVIAKSFIMLNIIQILIIQNKKNCHKNYHDIKSQLTNLFQLVLKNQTIPAFQKRIKEDILNS